MPNFKCKISPDVASAFRWAYGKYGWGDLYDQLGVNDEDDCDFLEMNEAEYTTWMEVHADDGAYPCAGQQVLDVITALHEHFEDSSAE